ncbi:branched-chain amino acid transport system ATP-binding protein [Rhodococcus sp. PvR044]|jgi:branched-chain amino acid transport system ATP-binding protein|uniref:ABC transporter ATP-binding protein n=1 Tax=Rhodococcus TaxID=1827 RepID=UPI000BDAE894|nr:MULTISPECIES: ABC transporter ATP-binding protein [Rhodococcus]MBP1160959.1 branched-chain amino acid transport system ATP-binding protein [Rhodococcus sp. PvR099]MCZ4557423.1 ABC transporter ATP-binding protein [Rhodococcus maanshanensis]PTR39957.1 amino acid/amide ABC transporter ATP-binding protein 2 (HAAT family) [Rhodococcus sp. OK611]SNX92424.1 amino acid/amide ABC transporter ATP-binding protein 2, HAAT family [Rhodococcus sp. OK270]
MAVDEHAPPILELDGVSVYYGRSRALNEVSIRVRPGEIVSLLGGNASGKSTTMKTALGLLTPTTGRVLIDGEDATAVAPAGRIKAGLASVPEARRVFPEMTVEENLYVGGYVHRERRSVLAERAAELFDHFPRLAERRRQHAGTLSGGEQQMLAFARALMSRPRLICMDEPTMGLSPLFVDRVLDEIVRLNERFGLAILIVEQQAELALSIAHTGNVLVSGEIVLHGEATDLLGNPAVREAYLGKVA